MKNVSHNNNTVINTNKNKTYNHNDVDKNNNKNIDKRKGIIIIIKKVFIRI